MWLGKLKWMSSSRKQILRVEQRRNVESVSVVRRLIAARNGGLQADFIVLLRVAAQTENSSETLIGASV